MSRANTLWRVGCALMIVATASRADELTCAGVLGNSGEQGATLVRFGPKDASGMGIVADRYGSIWDRGGAGALNRYALDGRLLATYKLPEHAPNRTSDTMTLAGDHVLVRSGGGLYALPIDAHAGSTAKALNVQAEWMSLSSRDGWVAAANKGEIFLANAAGERKAVATLTENIGGIELGPNGAVYVTMKDRLARIGPGEKTATAAGPVPGERPQFVAGAWFGQSWASTVRRFDANLKPAPGVVLGGNSGSFIGHVDEQAEIVNGRGLAQVGPDLFAISGLNGVAHLLQWSGADRRFTPVRRIGAVRACQALALDREGRVWYSSGMWTWSDGPATPLRFGIPVGDVFATTMLDSDSMVGYGTQYGRPTIYHGKLTTEIKRRWEEKSKLLPREGVAVVVTEHRKRRALVILSQGGSTTSVYIGADGAYEGDAATGKVTTATPVKQWTSLAAQGRDRLVGAADGFVIELTRDGDDWRESARWNSWGPAAGERFGDAIVLAADADRLWVSDTRRHRVVCLDAATRRLHATFGSLDAPGDSLAALSAPQTLAARGNRAIVFDSGNQRLIRLELRPAPARLGGNP